MANEDVVDASGLGLGGDIKVMYKAVSSRREVDGNNISIHSKMECGTQVIASDNLGHYEVCVYDKDYRFLRSYSGDRDSDAAKVYNSHSTIFAKMVLMEAAEKDAALKLAQ